MADEKYTFEQARVRLEEIASEVRKKDTSLEKSLDLLEEGVRLANTCTELVDHTDRSASVALAAPEASDGATVAVADGQAVEEACEGFDESDESAIGPSDPSHDD